MRKLILIAVITLISANANADPSDTFRQASSETVQPKTEQKADTPAPAEAPPLAVERLKLVAPQEQAKTPVTADKPEIAVRPKKKRVSTEARVIYELHRYGIYW